MFCVLPNTLTRWLYFTDSNPPPYQATLFASTIYGLSGVFNLILFFLTRPKMVVGQPQTHAVPNPPKDLVIPIHGRHELTRSSLQKKRDLSEYDYGILSVDVENYPSHGIREPGLSFELPSPSRTINCQRSYDLQGISRDHSRGASEPFG